jgi:hypothetical protein
MHGIYQLLAEYPYLALLQAAFTIWMLVDAYRRSAEGFWLWVIFLFQPLGAWVYFFAVKLKDFRGAPGLSLPAVFGGGPSLNELRYRAEQVPTLANHLALAQRLIERAEYAEAVPHLESALKTEPDHCQVLYALALCHVREGRPDQAVPLLERLLARDPRWSNYRGWHLLVEARDALGDSEGALKAAREAARLAPTLEHQCLLAEHLQARGQGREAHDVLDRALHENSFAPGPVRWRNRRWARQARRIQRRVSG